MTVVKEKEKYKRAWMGSPGSSARQEGENGGHPGSALAGFISELWDPRQYNEVRKDNSHHALHLSHLGPEHCRNWSQLGTRALDIGHTNISQMVYHNLKGMATRLDAILLHF